MKIEKIIEPSDEKKALTEKSGYAILALINNRVNGNLLVSDKNIIDAFFYGYEDIINYDNYINIANNFVRNNLNGYKPNLDDTLEFKTIK